VRRRSRYSLLYAPEVKDQLDSIQPKYQGLIKRAIEEQLAFAPTRRTRNRKPLENLPGPFGATWQLRFGPDNRLRVFYQSAAQEKAVWILAIGVKIGNRLLVAGKEFVP